jgi:hypothetical protein
MKAFIELPIINNSKYKLCTPTIEDEGDGFLINWDYQATSYAIQGRWCKWQRYVLKSEYDFNKICDELTSFIQKEYYS